MMCHSITSAFKLYSINVLCELQGWLPDEVLKHLWRVVTMGLDQLQMAPLVPDDSLLRFLLLKEKLLCYNTRHFSSGKTVLSSSWRT